MTEVHPDLIRRADFEPYLKHMARIEPQLFFRMLAGAGEHSADAFIDAIDVPALVVGAEFDQFTPGELSVEMAERIPDSKLLIINDGTHTAPIEFPALVNSRATQFIDERIASKPV
jgi:pimeloyl-ACP methyl ester carboxylesterase